MLASKRTKRERHYYRSQAIPRFGLVVTLCWILQGCTNNPYPRTDDNEKVLYLPFDEAPRTLDPAVAYTTTAHMITGETYATLLEYHYLKRPYTLIAGLAKRVPEAQPLEHGKVAYRFELREGLLYEEDPCFALGGKKRKTRPILAEDIAFEIMRIADPAVNSPVPEPFANIDGFREFSARLTELRKQRRGFDKLPTHQQYAETGAIRGLKVEGKTGLRIILSEPYPQILYWFAMPFSSPLPWEAVAYYDGKKGRPHLADHPVASGPYMVTRYDKQARIVMERNPNWHGARFPGPPGTVYPDQGESGDLEAGRLNAKVAGKPLPFIQRIEYRREKESIPAFNKFLQGYYDVSGIIQESFDKVIQEDNLSPEMVRMGMRLEKAVEPDIYYIGFNMEDPTVGAAAGERGKKLRQAMSLVTDVKEYTRLFTNGRGVPAQSLLPPGIFGYDPDYRNPYRALDYEKAKASLEQAGYPGGIDPNTEKPLRLTFDTPDTSATGLLRYQFLVNAWRKLGLDVRIEATNYNKFQEKVRDGAYQIFMWGWVADYPDPENFYFLLWSEMRRSKNQGPNTANFSNPEYDRLFLAMRSRDNDPERIDIMKRMRKILEDERPWIEFFHREAYMLFHGWMKNVKPSGLSTPMTKYRDIDAKERAKKRAAWNEPVTWPLYALFFIALLILIPGIRTYLRERQ
ncbi:MAG: peptide ABC transporter substrate-binding protein [Deltaproteobacteria bacterium]|nr:peptide ABC transporter substrate-binding protein [Deltaproteobacteria bacterium]